MTFELLTAASTCGPDAAIAIAGVALVGSVAVVVVWQALATWRTRIQVTREEKYRALAEQTARDLTDIRERLGADERPGEEEHDERVHQN
jgi:hypothetical protein